MTDQKLIETLEYAESRIDDAEDAIWSVGSEPIQGETEQSLDELVEELWAVQNRLEEIKQTVADDQPGTRDQPEQLLAGAPSPNATDTGEP